MRETPGIGDKILTDKDFLANFNALDVQLNADLTALANEVKTVKHGTKTEPWQVDAISGATITSRAVGARHQRRRPGLAADAGAEPRQSREGTMSADRP